MVNNEAQTSQVTLKYFVFQILTIILVLEHWIDLLSHLLDSIKRFKRFRQCQLTSGTSFLTYCKAKCNAQLNDLKTSDATTQLLQNVASVFLAMLLRNSHVSEGCQLYLSSLFLFSPSLGLD